MKLRRWLILAIAVVMLFSLVACSGSKNNDDSAATDNGGAATDKPSTSSPEQTDKPLDKVTFTYFVGVSGKQDVNINETTIGKILEDQTGVNFKMEYLVGDLNTKIGTMIAANEYPDVLVPDAAIDKVIGAGGFIDLTKYLTDDKYPNLKKVFGPYLNLMKAPDGKIYILPFSTNVGPYIGDPNINQGAFWVQRRVLEEAGFPKIRKFDDFVKLVTDFVDKHKDENLIGWLQLTHDWRFFATSNPPNHLLGYPNDGEVIIDMNTHEAHQYATMDATKRWLKTLNELNAGGYFDKSSFVDTYDQYIAKLLSHKVVALFDYGWQIAEAQNQLSDAARKDPSQDGYRYFPLPVTFDGGKDQYLDAPGFVKNRGAGITISAKDPDRIMAYFDNLLKEENQILRSWGVKGETYEVDDNGRFYRTPEQIAKLTDEFNTKYGLKYFSWDWPQWGTNSTLSDGNALAPGFQPEVFQMSLTDADKNFLNHYGVKTYTEMFSPPDDRPWFPAWGIPKEQGSLPTIFEAKKTEIVKKWFPKIVLGKPADFEKNWNDYVDEYNKSLDVKAYEQWYTDQVKAILDSLK